MPAPSQNINSDEQAKFVEKPSGETAVRTFIANDATEPVPISFTAAGDTATKGFIAIAQTIGTSQVEIKVGASALASRLRVSAVNDSIVTIFFGPDGVTTSGSAKGFPVEPTETIEYKLGPQAIVKLFAIAATAGNTILTQEEA